MIGLNEALAKDRWRGRLASHLDGFEALLDGQGYVKTTVQQKIKLLAGFCAWAERQDVPLSLLGEEDADRFLTELGRRPRRGDAWTIRQLLRYLRDTGGVPVPLPEVDTSAKGKLLDAFGEFLRTERGLSASTLTNYLPIVRGFLDEQFGGNDPDFDRLRVGDVHRFIVRRAQAGSPGRAKLVVTALRSFLRFPPATRVACHRSRCRGAWDRRLALGTPTEGAACRTGRTAPCVLRQENTGRPCASAWNKGSDSLLMQFE